MADKEIIKALEAIKPTEFEKSPAVYMEFETAKEILDLIKRQQAEIERKQEQIEKLDKAIKYTKGNLEIVLKNKDDRQLECERLINDARELIVEHSELNKQLKAENDALVKQQAISIFKNMELISEINLLKMQKSEAYKEFAEEFEKRCIASGIYPAITKNILKNLVKEKTEGNA